MRITQGMISGNSLTNLQSNLERIGKLQEQMSSGRQLNRPSDSPAGISQALSLRSGIKANTQYASNAGDAVAWLGTIDTTLTSSNELLQKVRDLTLQASSTGNADLNARQATATEVAGIRSSLLGLANTSYLGRPVFGGTTDASKAYADDGTYLGDSGEVTRRLAQDVTVRVDAPGPATFGDGDTSVFKLLDRIAANMTTNPAALQTDLADLDEAVSGVLGQLTAAGTRYARADSHQQAAADQVLALKSTLSGVENIDLPSTIMELQLQQTAYQSALGATAKVLQPSLLDFLK
ncbi:flagellar hook-associated protein FlgL [Angustibacter aerolatus]